MYRFAKPITCGLFFCLLTVGCNPNNDDVNKGKKPIPKITEHEKVVLRILLIDDLQTLASGDDATSLATKLVGDHVITTSHTLQTEYEKNEVAGDMKFRNKTIFLTGKVSSIDRSVGENYFIGLVGGSNMFMKPKASMADGYKEFLAGLSKGETLSLACVGDGMLMGSAMLKGCLPPLQYAVSKADSYLKGFDLSKTLSGDDKEAKLLAIASIATRPHLQQSSACFTEKNLDVKKCMSEIITISNKEGFQADLSAAASDLGQDLSAITGKAGSR